jgi:hypothetical protein
MLNIEGKENFIIRNSLFDLPAIASRHVSHRLRLRQCRAGSGEAGGYSIFKIGYSNRRSGTKNLSSVLCLLLFNP